MNLRTCKTLVAGVAALLFMTAASCTDTTVEPKSTVSDANIFSDPASYTAFIAKLYAGLAVTGQVGPNGNTDIQTPDEGFNQYIRVLWYSQEVPTDEAVLAWGDPGVPDLNRWNWGPRRRIKPGSTSTWGGSRIWLARRMPRPNSIRVRWR